MVEAFLWENKDKYSANEKDYVEKLNKLNSDFKDNLSKIEGKKVLVLDETLPPLCTFAKLKTIEIESDHENESISADAIKNTIEEIIDRLMNVKQELSDSVIQNIDTNILHWWWL